MSHPALRVFRMVALASVLAAAAIAAFACAAPKAPTGPPGIVGKIESIQGDGNEWSILVVGGKQAAGAVSDKASCRITADTTILDSAGVAIGPDRLRQGDNVAVWFTGPVAESYPVQGTASRIEVREAAQ